MHDTTTPKGTDPMQITIITDRLTDGSEVFNVRVGETVFHAVTERDASDFARKLQTLIHTRLQSGIFWPPVGRSARAAPGGTSDDRPRAPRRARGARSDAGGFCLPFRAALHDGYRWTAGARGVPPWVPPALELLQQQEELQMITYFREDNTDGYDATDLKALNQAIRYIVESHELVEKSEIDGAMAEVLAAYDRGLRAWDVLAAYDRQHPCRSPTSASTRGIAFRASVNPQSRHRTHSAPPHRGAFFCAGKIGD